MPSRRGPELFVSRAAFPWRATCLRLRRVWHRPLWGDPNIIRERLGAAVRDIVFDRGTMLVPALSPQHHRMTFERTAGPLVKLVEMLGATDLSRLALFRSEYEAIVAQYFESNVVRQDYLMTRATKI